MNTQTYGPTQPLFDFDVLSVQRQTLLGKQLNGTAMGSPVSVVVAEIVMQNIEEQALATYTRTIPLWLRYVDDTFHRRTRRRNRRFSRTPQQTERRHTVHQGDRRKW